MAPPAVLRRVVAHPVVERHPGRIAGVAWFVVYLVVVAGGQHFDTGYLQYAYQLVPWKILVHDPIGSVWYLHIQPPLWNLLLGLLGRLSPVSDARTLQILMASIGVALAGTVTCVVRRLRMAPWTAIAIALLVTVNPEVLFGAFSPTYELPVALLLALAVLGVQRTVAGGRSRDLVLTAAVVTAVVLTRSLYHPLMVPVLLGPLWWVVRRKVSRRAVALTVAIPLVLIGGWLVKNQILFGDATTSSWLGMNLERSTVPILGAAELRHMHDDGDLNDVALIPPFSVYDLYRPVMPACSPAHDHPALSSEGVTDPDGAFTPNFNYECYLPVYDAAMHNFWKVASEHPAVWWQGRVFSARVMFTVSPQPAWSASLPMRTLDRVYRVARLDVVTHLSTEGWGSPMYGPSVMVLRCSLLVLLLYALVIGDGMRRLFVSARRTRRRSAPAPEQPSADTTVAATVITTAFLALVTVVVGIVGELSEQGRFRTMTDPVVLAVGITLAQRALQRHRRRGAHPAEQPEPVGL